MKSPSLKAVTEVTCLAQQFLVDDLSEAMRYYRDRSGFEPDFVYEPFYVSLSCDGFSIHQLTVAPEPPCRGLKKRSRHCPAIVQAPGLLYEFYWRGAKL